MAIVGSKTQSQSFGRSLTKRFNALDDRMNDLYRTTYASRPDNKRDLDRISGDIGNMLDKVLGDADIQRISDISNLYLRLQQQNGVSNEGLITSSMELFSDNSIVNALSMSSDVILRSVQAEDYQYDLICKYMPKLEDALDIKKDNVLSSDNFTKEFMTIKSDKHDENSAAHFYQRAKAVKEKYKVPDIYERMVQKASKYGEAFVYCVPYDVAIQRLLDRRATNVRMAGFGEGYITESVLFEHSQLENVTKKDKVLGEALKKVNVDSNMKVNLLFNDSGCLNKEIQTYHEARCIMESVAAHSLTECYNVLSEQTRNAVDHATALKEAEDFNKGLTSVFSKKETKKSLVNVASDGLIVPGYTKNCSNEKVKNLNGAVVTILDRGSVLPIYITEDICVGYYYFNFHNTGNLACCDNGLSSTAAMSHTYMGRNYVDDPGIDELVGYIARQMSGAIDAHFINSNKDLKEEIYAILRYNDQFDITHGVNNVTVTFIPADDIEHFYFEMDEKTHRGISDLKRAVVPAMLYCMLYLTDAIGQVTRAQDKRIYYVKQNVETNVARTMMNVINQLKKGNLGMRQLSSMNSILNIVGKYNDHVIPVGQSGDAPVQFEVMSGQDLKTPTELMERFEDMAVSSTDVPLEFVQTVNQVDYATRFTMSNSKFLRKIFRRQRICQNAFSRIFTKIYNYEYNENEHLIKVMLPAPAFLMLTNSQQLINNTKDYINAIVEIEMSDKDEKVQQIFRKKMVKVHLGSYLDYDQIDEFIRQSEIEAELNKSSDDGDGGY